MPKANADVKLPLCLQDSNITITDEVRTFYSAVFINATFDSNTAIGGGGALSADASNVTLYNNYYVGNTAGDELLNDEW